MQNRTANEKMKRGMKMYKVNLLLSNHFEWIETQIDWDNWGEFIDYINGASEEEFIAFSDRAYRRGNIMDMVFEDAEENNPQNQCPINVTINMEENNAELCLEKMKKALDKPKSQISEKGGYY